MRYLYGRPRCPDCARVVPKEPQVGDGGVCRCTCGCGFRWLVYSWGIIYNVLVSAKKMKAED